MQVQKYCYLNELVLVQVEPCMYYYFKYQACVFIYNANPNEPTKYLIVELSLLASTFQENQDFHLLLLLFKAYDNETQLHLTRPTHHYPSSTYYYY